MALKNFITDRKPSKKQKIILFAFPIAILIAIFLYWPILLEISEKVIHREGSSHVLFVPFISLYLIWLKRGRLKNLEMRLNLLGLIPIMMSILLYFLEIGGEKPYFQSVSFILMILGLLFLFMGKKVFKHVCFPVLFLICMIPLPTTLYIYLAEITRDINLGGATWIMSKLHMPFLQKDLCIFLPNSTLNVNIGCSGIRYLLSFFVFGIAYSYIFRKKLMNRLLLIGLTIPIAIFAGSIRLSVISFCAYYIGPHMAEHRPHVILSWFVFFIIGMSLIILDKLIMKRRMRKNILIQSSVYGNKLTPENEAIPKVSVN